MDVTRNQQHSAARDATVSRRTAIRGLGGGGVAVALGIVSRGHAHADDTQGEPQSGSSIIAASTATAMIEPDAGSWKTWILASGDALRPSAPPDAGTTEVEMAELRTTAADRDAETLDRVSHWDAGSPGYRWNEIAMQQTLKAGYGPGDAYRTMALVNVAIYDATVAAWDAKYTYSRPRPAVADPSFQTVIATPASPSYPSEHAATAGAAATVLAYLFPEDAETFARLASEAAESRVLAGVEYPSDATVGMDLGRQVGERVVTYAKADGSDAEFDWSTAPTGDGVWTGEGVYPMMGTWETWVLEDGSALRPPPPPEWNSTEREAELAEVRSYQRDAHPFTELFFWPMDPAGRPEPDSVPVSSNQVVFYYAPVLHFLWGPELAQKIFEYRLDDNPPRAARAYALVSVASFDATVAAWDAKYHYWTARPDQFDPEITTVLPTYPIPDYPSGHAATLGGTAQVLAHLFPRDAHVFQSRAEENAASRVWAGIHFRSAAEVGVELGRNVGQLVVDYAMTDGAS